MRVARSDGQAFTSDWNLRLPASLLASAAFDVVRSKLSGKTIVVYESGAGTPRYRILDDNRWSDELSLPRQSATALASTREGIVKWVKLAAKPGSDDVALLYTDDQGKLFGWLWDGSRWVPESAALLAEAWRRTYARSMSPIRTCPVRCSPPGPQLTAVALPTRAWTRLHARGNDLS